jgi:hypothetical protein
MRPEVFRYLTSPEGAEVLASLAAAPVTPDNQLVHASRLRRLIGPERAQATIEQALLRRRAEAKFSRAAEMFFTRDGLEQATAEPVATHRARRFADAGFTRLADLACGIGGDALALSAAADVIGLDRDPLRLAMARANVAAYGRGERFLPVAADLTTLPPLPVEAFCFDPARRTPTGPGEPPSRRLFDVEAYQPPLSLIRTWLPRVRHGAVKVSPAVDYDDLPPEAEIEFVSYRGEVREGILWFGDLRRGRRRATLLPRGQTLTDSDDAGEPVDLNPPQAYLIEPDGAVIRAHLVTALARQTRGSLLSADIAYLTSDEYTETPFGRVFRLETWFPFQLKRLRAYLRDRHVGQVTIKKRGSPLDPEDLRRALALKGSERRILFLTQVAGKPAVLVAFDEP